MDNNTDEDPAVIVAIKQVLETILHHFCTCPILKKAPNKVGLRFSILTLMIHFFHAFESDTSDELRIDGWLL